MSIPMVAGTMVNVGTEAFVISFVGHGSPSTMGFLKGIFTLDMVTIAGFLSILNVSSVVVIHSI